MASTTPVIARAETPAADQQTTGLADIVVTARRVEERLQDVPLSITALDAKVLKDSQIDQVQDIGAQIASVNTGKTAIPGSGQVAIRGVQGQTLPRATLDNRVGVYLDGVYIARAQGQSFNLADIERIEVLKGPQGTLFGRNVTAGAINIITQAPTGRWGGIVEGGYGSRDRQRYRATLNLPETAGFSVRLSYLHEQQDGDIKNLASAVTIGPVAVNVPAMPATATAPASPAYSRTFIPHKSAKSLGANNSDSVFAAVRYEGIDGLTADYKFDWTDQKDVYASINIVGWSGAVGNGCFAAAIALGANTNVCGGNLGVISTPGTITNVGGANGYFVSTGAQNLVFGNTRPKTTYQEFAPYSTVRTWGHNLTLNYDASEHLHLRSITGYRDLRTLYQQGQDGGDFSLNNSFLTSVNPSLYPASAYPAGGVTRFPIGISFTTQNQHQFSEEVQAFGSATDWLDYLVGGYYFRERTHYVQGTVNSNASSAQGILNALNGVSGIGPYAPNGGTTQAGLGVMAAGEDGIDTSRSQAIFGRLTVKPVDALDIVVGARYTRDRKSATNPQFLVNFLDFDPATPGRQQPPTDVTQRFHRFTYDGTVTYHVTPDVNVYGRYATAYLAGGLIRQTPFLPETTKAAELGLKSELFDHKLRFNAALFHQKSRDTQFTSIVTGLPAPVNSSTVVRNLGSVRLRGAEAEVTAVPVRGLTLSGNVGYVDQKYVSSVVVIRRPPVPAWTLNGSIQYDTPPLFDDAYLSFRFDANYRSRYNPSVNVPIQTSVGATGGTLPAELLALYGLPNTPEGRLAYAALIDKQQTNGGFWLANARLSLAHLALLGTTGRFSIYARNLFDEKKGKTFTANYGIAVGGTFVERRSFGADLSLEF